MNDFNCIVSQTLSALNATLEILWKLVLLDERAREALLARRRRWRMKWRQRGHQRPMSFALASMEFKRNALCLSLSERFSFSPRLLIGIAASGGRLAARRLRVLIYGKRTIFGQQLSTKWVNTMTPERGLHSQVFDSDARHFFPHFPMDTHTCRIINVRNMTFFIRFICWASISFFISLANGFLRSLRNHLSEEDYFK